MKELFKELKISDIQIKDIKSVAHLDDILIKLLLKYKDLTAMSECKKVIMHSLSRISNINSELYKHFESYYFKYKTTTDEGLFKSIKAEKLKGIQLKKLSKSFNCCIKLYKSCEEFPNNILERRNE